MLATIRIIGNSPGQPRVALVTGASRAVGIASCIATTLAADGRTVAVAGWRKYDDRMPWGSDETPPPRIDVDLTDPGAPERLMGQVGSDLGSVTALALRHTESVNSSILDTTTESFDRHFAVDTRATWLLIKTFAEQLTDRSAGGRIVALTSDHTPFNLPYGASRGAMDRIVPAAVDLADLGVTANVVNPRPTDTGWMTAEVESQVLRQNLQHRIGTPTDCANLVRFLCSEMGRWINRQLIHSDGGRRT